jgi:uncharacterized membrane protein
MFMMLFLWAGVILLGVFAVEALFNHGTRGDERDDALNAHDILARRYARGEISKETYDRMLDDLA